jgi:hypothetical protein
MKYICKNNPNHTFTKPTADFWCPLCEKNTGMLELLEETTEPSRNDEKQTDLKQEIDSLKKEITRLNDSLKESEAKSIEKKDDFVDEIENLKKRLTKEKEDLTQETSYNQDYSNNKNFINNLLETNTVHFTNKLFDSIILKLFKSKSQNPYILEEKENNKKNWWTIPRKTKDKKLLLIVLKVCTVFVLLFIKLVAFIVKEIINTIISLAQVWKKPHLDHLKTV